MKEQILKMLREIWLELHVENKEEMNWKKRCKGSCHGENITHMKKNFSALHVQKVRSTLEI